MSKFADSYVPKFADCMRITLADFAHGTVAWIIQRVIEDVAGNPVMHQYGTSSLYLLLALQRSPFGKKRLPVDDSDLIEYFKWRRSSGVSAATALQDYSLIRGVFNYSMSTWKDCKPYSGTTWDAVRSYLGKHRLIGKSKPREARPTNEQHEQLRAYFAKQNEHPRTTIDMVKVLNWQIASGRRISETCRLWWGDWDKENHTILVRDMKHPTKKDGNHKIVALPPAAQAMLLEMEPHRLRPNDPTERIFPYNQKCCSQRHSDAKRKLGIKEIVLHDNRAECGTRLVEDEGYSPSEAILVTGHETTKVFERVYLRMKPENFKLGPVALRKAREQSKDSPHR